MAESIFPEIRVFTPVKALCECLGSVARRLPTMLPSVSDLSLTTHKGAEKMLSDALDQPPTLFDDVGVEDATC